MNALELTCSNEPGIRHPLAGAVHFTSGPLEENVSTRAKSHSKPFSWGWTFISMVTFMVVELVLGGWLGPYVAGRYKSMNLAFMLQGSLHLVSYFMGGMLIGLFSPGIRVLEPAVGAFGSIVLVLVLTVFTPYQFIGMSLGKLLVGGGIAFFLALMGARVGEKLAGNDPG